MWHRESASPRRLGAIFLVLPFIVLAGCQMGSRDGVRLVETRDENGFTITETARLGVGDRGRFEDAIASIEAGDAASGIATLEALVEENPELVTLHVNLGIARQRSDDLESAEAALRRALGLYPTHPIALNELGIVLRRQGRFDESKAAYESALERHPDFHHARRNLAILCDLYLGDLDCALSHYERYQKAVPHEEDVAIWISDLQNRRNSGAN